MYKEYISAWLALLYRDIQFILSQLPSRLIDGFIVVCAQTLAIGSFLPLLGMPAYLTGPLYIGTITQITFASAFTIAFRLASDLKNSRYIEYELTLPLPASWVVAKIIFSFMIQLALVGCPLIFLGALFLGNIFSLQKAHIFFAIIMYSLTLLFYALLFVYLAIHHSYTWFCDNTWVRRLTPLFLLGCSYFTWYKLYAFNPFLARFLLLNPLTYIHEGLRTALLGPEEFLAIEICIPMLIIFCVGLFFLLAKAVKKRLDPA